MRIERLSLDFFGHFAGKVFKFGKVGQNSDFHLIYGANEAGKTTMMEGYLRLLYGFPKQDRYAFRSQRQNLRVSGLLDISGKTREFIRLPALKDNLRDEADAALPETMIASHLGGLSLDDYRRLLCLDDRTIEEGGEEIANAKGDIGRLLFSAAAGIADLNSVIENTKEEASEIYKKQAKKTRIAELKRDLAEVGKAIRDTNVSATEWQSLKAALQIAKDEEGKAKVARDDLHKELTRINALRRSLPNLNEHDRLLSEIADFVDYPNTIDINPDQLVTMMTEQVSADAELSRLKNSIEENKNVRAALVLDKEQLTLAERLDEIDELRSRMQTANLDIPKRRETHSKALAKMTQIARDLGGTRDCDVASLVKSPAEITALEDLRENMQKAAADREAGKREIEDLQNTITQAEEDHQALLDASPTGKSLVDLLKQFGARELATTFAKATEAIATADSALQEALDALAVNGRNFTELPDCPVDQKTAAKFAQQHASLTEKIAKADENLEAHEENIAAMAAKITSLKESIDVATDEEAQDARTQRDTLWQSHRNTLTAETAERFEPAMRRMDDINVTRLAHATELGEIRKLSKDMAETEARTKTIKLKRDKLIGQAKEIEIQVEKLAKKSGLQALSPSVYSDWVVLHDKARTKNRRCNELTTQHRETLDRAERLRQELGPFVAMENPSFESALSAAEDLADAERSNLESIRESSGNVKRLNADLGRRKREQSKFDSLYKRASENWKSKVRSLFGEVLSPCKLAVATGQLRELREHDAVREEAEHRVTTMEDDQRRFTKAVTNLGSCFGLEEPDPLKMYQLLREIAKQATADKIRYEELGATLEKDVARRDSLVAKLENTDRTVKKLGGVFPKTVNTSTLDALRTAVGDAHEVITKRGRITELEGQILHDLSQSSIDEARAMIGEETASSLEAKEITLKGDLKLAEETLSTATVARVNKERDLGAITGDADIAELVERSTTLQLQIKEAVLNYLELDFGLRLAEDAIRRYRDKHRSEMMASTERAFTELTNGAYKKLETRPDGSSEVLLAVDTDDIPKQTSEMSKGTRFQLYLALRAAAYEQLVTQGVKLPFFCDDVFETFDDDRTRAACRMMERIGRSGQAIYLTHHRHVVDIARDVCDEQPIIHEI